MREGAEYIYMGSAHREPTGELLPNLKSKKINQYDQIR